MMLKKKEQSDKTERPVYNSKNTRFKVNDRSEQNIIYVIYLGFKVAK